MGSICVAPRQVITSPRAKLDWKVYQNNPKMHNFSQVAVKFLDKNNET